MRKEKGSTAVRRGRGSSGKGRKIPGNGKEALQDFRRRGLPDLNSAYYSPRSLRAPLSSSLASDIFPLFFAPAGKSSA